MTKKGSEITGDENDSMETGRIDEPNPLPSAPPQAQDAEQEPLLSATTNITAEAVPIAQEVYPVQEAEAVQQPVLVVHQQPPQHQPVQQQVVRRREVTFVRIQDNRGCCSWFGNMLWLLLGGWQLFLTWFAVGCLLCLTIIGIPCGIQVIKISIFLLFPFGQTLVYSNNNNYGDDSCCNFRCCCTYCLNGIWALTVGWILALQAILTGIVFCTTLIGIPFGIQCFKLAVLCFCPFGLSFTAEHEEIVSQTATTTTTQYTRM